MEALFNNALEWITLHPHLTGLVIFVIALLESLIVIGLLIPGAVVLFGIGAILATVGLPVLPILVWCAAGAIAGDLISFLIGRHYHQRLRVMWPLKRYPKLVNRGVDFFFRHGGKSIFMGRFIGPIRPILPAVAGMMDMTLARFLFVDIFAAILWAPAYIFPGMVFGASLELAAEVAGRLVVLILGVLVAAWLIVFITHNVYRLLQPLISRWLDRVLDWSRSHPHVKPLAGSLLDPGHPEARGLAILSMIFFVTGWLLVLISQQVIGGSLFQNIDQQLLVFLQHLRTPFGDQLMVFFTQLGDKIFLTTVVVTGSAWLLIKGNSKAAIHWLAVLACAAIMTWIFKVTAQIARPADYYDGYAFPSAHTGLSVVAYGFLALVIARELTYKHRWIPYSIAGVLVMTIGLSRLYLGAHWFSDVLGGLSLGLFWLALIGIAYDHHPAPAVKIRSFAIVCTTIFIVALGMQHQLLFKTRLAYYAPRHLASEMADSTWFETGWQQLPAYRADLEGNHKHPLNIQWAGSLIELEAQLATSGWTTPASSKDSHALNWLSPAPDINKLPLLPQVHKGHNQSLLMIKAIDENRLIAIRLWSSSTTIYPSEQMLWIGNTSFLTINQTLPLISYLQTEMDFNTPLKILLDDLPEQLTRKVVMRQPSANKTPMTWHGEVLLARHTSKASPVDSVTPD